MKTKTTTTTSIESELKKLIRQIDLMNCDCNMPIICEHLLNAKHDDRRKIYCLGYWQNLVAAEYLTKKLKKNRFNAEAAHLGEFKHGPLALVDGNFLCVVFNPKDETFEDTYNNIREIYARPKPFIVAIANEPQEHYSTYIKIPEMKDQLLYPYVEMLACDILLNWLLK